ncbi:MAG: ABC transporter ATP-binding protein [Anaerolineae bacterium]
MAVEPVIVTQQLRKTFGHITAVAGLDLAVGRGEIVGLVGPDGAGKTTTMRMLAGIMSPTSGHAQVMGYDPARQASAMQAHVGYMAQRFNLYGDLTVSENLDFFASVYGVRGAEYQTRRARVLDFARLSGFQSRRAANLSGGMQKKLALAATMVHAPSVLFLDEPTNGVDPVSRRELWEILTQLHLDGITILISTPYMDEADRCSRVAFLYAGRLLVCDTPDNIRSRLPGQLLEVYPSNVGQSRLLLSNLPGVLEVQTHGDRLHVFVDDGQQRTPQLMQALEGADIVATIRPIRPNMEEAFISLVHHVTPEKPA